MLVCVQSRRLGLMFYIPLDTKQVISETFLPVAYPGFHFEAYKFNLPGWELVALAVLSL